MADLIWSMFCEKAIVDKQSNEISLIGIIEQFQVSQLPIVIPHYYYVISLWEKNSSLENQEEIFRHRVKFNPEPEEISKKEMEFETIIPGDKIRMRTINGIRGIPIKEEGDLYLIIEQYLNDSWEEVHKIRVRVAKTE